MSLSKDISKSRGRIIIGLGSEPLSEETLKQTEQPVLNPELEAQFWQRVRLRAEQKAREIIARAMEEAEGIKARAQEEGFKEGYAKGLKEGQAKGYSEGLTNGRAEAQKECENEFEALKQEFSTQFGTLMRNIEEKKENFLQEYKEELVLLTKASVEKILHITLDENKEQILNNLFHQAMEQLEDKKKLCIRAHPDDIEIMQEMLEKARAEYPQLDKWQLKPDPAIEQGGVILENENSIINNTIDVRYAEVKKIVDQLDVE